MNHQKLVLSIILVLLFILFLSYCPGSFLTGLQDEQDFSKQAVCLDRGPHPQWRCRPVNNCG